jgi:predicted Zn-dependent peptidase
MDWISIHPCDLRSNSVGLLRPAGLPHRSPPSWSRVYRTSRLENGLTVATAEMPHMTSVSVGLWMGVGSRSEPAALNGACHFIEHLLFKGTATRSAREISQAVEGVGGYLNAFTSEETTCLHARAGYARFEELLEVLMDMLLHSRFAPADVRKEREVIKEEIAMYLDEPQHYVQELLNATLWPEQPLGRPITGSAASLDRMNRSLLLGYLADHYTSASVVVVAAGRVEHSQVLKAVNLYARRFPTGRRHAFPRALWRQQAPVVRLFTKATEQTQAALGIRTCSRHDERRFALRLLNTILGENMSSRLFQVIREDRALAYSIYSTPSFFHDTGDLVISCGCDTDKLERVLRLAVRELRRFVNRRVTPSELQRARDYLLGQLDLGQESTETQMNWLGEHLLGYGTALAPAEIRRNLSAVTAAQVQAVAKDFFQPAHLNLAVVSPLKDAKPLLRILEKSS